MTIRAKLQVTAITSHVYTGGKTIRLSACYDQSTPEDQRFCEATPSGHLEMLIDNPAVLSMLELGQYFYIALIPVAPK